MATRPKRSGKEDGPEPQRRAAEAGEGPRQDGPNGRRRRASPRPPSRRPRARARRPGRCARHRRVAHQGQDHREVPRLRLRREGHRRAPARPPHPRARGGRRARVRAQVRHHQRQDEDARGAEEGRQGRLHHLPRHRPRPRGRGDRLARRRPDHHRACPTHRVLFDEITRDAVLAAMEQPGADRRAEGGRPAGPPDPRPAGGLQGEPDPLAHASRPASPPAGCRPSRSASSSSASGRSAPSSRRSTGPSRRSAPRTARPSRRRSPRWTATSPSSTPRPRPGRWWTRCAQPAVRRHQGGEAPAGRSGRRAPFTTSTHPAGGRQEARLLRRGAPCARRRISTRAWTSARKGRSASSPTCGPTRSGCPTRRSPPRGSSSASSYGKRYLPDAPNVVQRPEERPGAGRPRGDPAHRRAPAPGAGAEVPRARSVPALPAHLAALRRLADDAGRLRHDGRRVRPRPVSVPGHRLGHGLRRLPRAVHRGTREGGGPAGGGSRRRFRRSPRATGWRCGRSRPRSTSPSRRRASPRPAW